jgi:hypothetical protein
MSSMPKYSRIIMGSQVSITSSSSIALGDKTSNFGMAKIS